MLHPNTNVTYYHTSSLWTSLNGTVPLVCTALYAVFAFYGDDSNADVAMEASSVVKAGNSCKVYQRKCIVMPRWAEPRGIQ